jgi:uncharacterized protein involved in outer membrane biogenesis
MKFVFRWAFRLFIVLVVLVVAGILLLDTIAREYVEYQIHSQTGMETRIGKVRVGLLNPQLTIENLVLYNSAAFGGSPFVEMPELHVEYDRDSLLSHKLRLKLLRFNVARINLVEDKKGRRNFDSIQGKALPLGSMGGLKKGSSTNSSSQMPFAIDTLNLTLGKVTYMRMNDPGKVDEFNMKVDHQVFTNIKSEQDFSSALLAALIRSGANLFQTGASGQNLLQLFGPPKSNLKSLP